MGSGLKVVNIFEYNFSFLTPKPSNKSTLFIGYSVLFNYFSSTSTNLVILVLESFMTVKPDQPWKSISGDMLTLNLVLKSNRRMIFPLKYQSI